MPFDFAQTEQNANDRSVWKVRLKSYRKNGGVDPRMEGYT